MNLRNSCVLAYREQKIKKTKNSQQAHSLLAGTECFLVPEQISQQQHSSIHCQLQG